MTCMIIFRNFITLLSHASVFFIIYPDFDHGHCVINRKHRNFILFFFYLLTRDLGTRFRAYFSIIGINLITSGTVTARWTQSVDKICGWIRLLNYKSPVIGASFFPWEPRWELWAIRLFNDIRVILVTATAQFSMFAFTANCHPYLSWRFNILHLCDNSEMQYEI